jgi:hypothetical protein
VPRYWYPREREFDLSAFGFLWDPTGQYGEIFAAGASSLASLRDKTFLVLIGEPGTGKSTEFERNIEAIEGRIVCFVNLHDHGTEESVRVAILGHRQVERWKREGGVLELFLDSYDESSVRSLASILQSCVAELAGWLEGIRPPGREVLPGQNGPEQSNEGVASLEEVLAKPQLYVRLACRMGVYDSYIGRTVLKGLSATRQSDDPDEETAEQEYGPYEYKLAPLREVDVRTLIRSRGHDPDDFLREVQRLSIGFLAAKPITLDLLLRAYDVDRSLGESAVEIYEKGVRRMCEEPSRYRRVELKDRPDTGRRVRAAQQAAALSIVCGRPELWLENDTDCPSASLLTVGDIALGEIIENDVYDLANTALLVPMSMRQFGWAHKTIAEYLAGTHLVRSELSAGQIINLLVDSESSKTFPQFRETAAWVAAGHDEFRRWMIANEPETVLGSDVALFAASDKEAIVSGLLNALDREELFIVESDASGRYDRLSYPGLSSQLRPWILDRKRSIFVRREAIEVAEACRLSDLEPDLVGIALAVNEDRSVRISAAHAIVKYGSVRSKHRLRPLVDEPIDRDPDAELRGYGLTACWPDGIALVDALRAIDRPRKGRLIGAFWSFKKREFAKGFQREFLIDSLVWMLRSEGPRRGRPSEDGVAAVVFAEAWRALEDRVVCDLLGRIWARRAKRFQETFEFEDADEDESSLSQEDLTSSLSKRRALVESVVRHSKGNDNVLFSLVQGQRRLLTTEDADWVWEHVFIGDARERNIWAELSFWLPPDRERVVIAAETEPAVRKAFAAWLAPPVPESRQTRYIREREEKVAAQEEEQRARAEKANIPERINEGFDKALAAPAKFWILHTNLIFDAQATGSELSWVQPDSTRLPGWELLTEDRKASWGDLCERYLQDCSAVSEGWRERTIHHPDVAGYRSLRWLIENRPEYLFAQNGAFYEKWASAVVFMTDQLWNQETEFDEALLRLFYSQVPATVRRWLTMLLEREARFGTDSLVFRHFDAIWDDALGDLFVSFARKRTKNASYRYGLLKMLVARGYAPAIAYAKKRLLDDRGSEESRRARRVGAAKALIEASDASWAFLLPILRHDLDLARTTLAEFMHGSRDENLGQIRVSIGHAGLGELYELLLDAYPNIEDEVFEGGFMNARESAIWFRDTIPRYLSGLGTPEALFELMRLAAAHPGQTVLKMYVLSARKQLRRVKWRPAEPEEVVRLCRERAGRLVESEDQLLEVVVESLFTIGERMVRRGEYESYWHEPQGKGDLKSLRPKDENMLSGFIAARLEDHLVGQGIVINREVEVRRGNKTDIYVTAISRRKATYEPITVVIETKGCWHPELALAMESQLMGEYMSVTGRNRGIYLVGWFDCDAWAGRDSRRSACARAARILTKDTFEQQALRLSTGGKLIRYIGLDCRYYRRIKKDSQPD